MTPTAPQQANNDILVVDDVVVRFDTPHQSPAPPTLTTAQPYATIDELAQLHGVLSALQGAGRPGSAPEPFPPSRRCTRRGRRRCPPPGHTPG